MEACCSRFTAAEGGARLAAAASSKNTLAVEYASFIATRLVHEDAYKIRGSLCEGRQRSVHVTRASRVDVVAYELHILTDLAITKSIRYDDVSDWSAELDKKEVLVCTSVVLKQLLEEKILSIPNMNVLILDSCHLVCKDDNLQYIMNLYKECKEERRPRILALTYPLFASPKKEPQDKLTNNNDSSRNVEKLPKIDETDEAAIKNGTVDTDTNIEETNIATTETDTKIENLDVKIAEIDVETTETKIIEIDTEEDTTDSKVEETDIEIENTSGKIETSNETEESTVEKNDDESKIKEVIKFEEEIGVSKNLDDFEMYEKLEWKIEELEKELCCQMDLAEDIDGGKRLSATIAKPKEIIVEYSAQPTREQLTESYVDLEKFMKDTVNEATKFIEEHRYDPTEIYGEEMYEEFMKIPDPTIEPKNVFRQFLYVLEQLGPYAADKAAFSLLTKLEKLKIKVPYERHFLLLCLCTTVFVKIRCYADDVFTKCETDWEKLRSFSTPKVLRFAEILEKFQPPEQTSKEIPKNADGISKTATDKKELSVKVTEMLKDIERCDFISLSNKIEDKVNTYEADLKEIHDLNIENINTTNELNNAQNESNEAQNETNKAQVETENSHNEANNAQEDTIIGQNENNKSQIETENLLKETDNAQDDTKIVQNESNKTQIETKNAQNDISSAPVQHKGILGFSRRAGHRARGRGRVQRSNAARVQQLQQNPDALCGIVFMKEALMAKIMFMLIVDMSRCNPKLAYLCAQYCAVETPADPGTEPRECQRQGKKQEDVLKKFRMHECNLLLATSALEEGIDLPRCNLVLRWDVPASYRSYGLCRSRARAPRAACCVLSRAAGCDTDTLLHNVAVYRELDQMISRKCGCGVQDEPPQTEEDHADTFTTLVTPYTPKENINDSKPASEPLNNDIKLNNDCDNDDVKTLDKTGSIHVDVTKNDERGIVNNENVNDNNYISKIVNDKPIDNDNDKIIDKTRRIHDDVNKNDERGIVNDVNINDNNDISKMVNDKSNDNEFVTNCDSVDEKILEKQNPSKNSEKISDENPEKIDKDSSSDKRKLNDCENLRVNENLQCNKCNNKRSSVNLECHCVVNVKNKLDSGDLIDRNKCDRKTDGDTTASVDLSSAIALINRYCGKLPSDTFTRLAPQWWMEQVKLPIRNSTEIRNAYICTLRLPLNCPVKYNIVGHPMPTRVLARRMVALQACRILHKSGELDNQLMPIGKENFKAAELEATGGHVISNGGDCSDPSDSARPGTTKRRQYYFKRTAWAFTDCQPVVDTTDADIEPPGTSDKEHCQPDRGAAKQEKKGTKRNMLYAIVSKLWCALPERYNTRGRRLHAPQNASQAIGILMARDEPDNLQIPAFPVYTRSGEVRVSVEHVSDADVRVSPRRGRLVRRFMRFVFAEVLRVRRRGMKLQSEGSTHNNYYIVPTVKTIREDGTTKIDIDWPFLELIYQHTEEKKHSEIEKPILWHHDEEEAEDGVQNKVERKEEREEKVKKMENPLLKDGESFAFDAEMYKEAVVTPWYRNQDQPQFFLVAEICWNLTPDSAFPSATHTSFRNYYTSKYAVVLSQSNQPLLDVDHTSARLNLLTPRYVNRKGVALPVSSERTRRAKRDRLDQKQILVPELCRVHPFAAPLWFATVALPCVLYRINALLIADEIRRAVAIDVGLGIPKIDESTSPGFQWPPLDFGWSLAEVLSADSEKSEKKKEDDDSSIKEEKDLEEEGKKSEIKKTDEEPKEKTINDILQKEINESGFEIGTWSNDMASSIPQEEEYDEYMEPLPPNLTFCTSASGGTNWCDPIEKPKNQFNPTRGYSMADSDCSYMSSDFDTDDSDLNTDASDDDTDTSGFCSTAMGVRIEYKTAHEAEAVDVERKKNINPAPQPDDQDDTLDRSEHDQFMRSGTAPGQYIEKFHQSVSEHKKEIIENGFLIHQDEPILEILPDQTEKQTRTNTELKSKTDRHKELIDEIFPFGSGDSKLLENGQISLDAIEKNKRLLLDELKKTMSEEEIKKLNCFSMVDVDIDSPLYVNEKVVNVGFDTKDSYIEKVRGWVKETACKPYYEEGTGQGFDFDYQPKLEGHPGPSPSVILQALTMSNANDGINLERLETIGDSFLKFAITAYLYCAHPTVHEGKLSHMRSKQVSNLNLYRLGRNKRLGARMIASKFEPHDNWLPPCHKPPSTLHPRMADLHQQNMMSDAPPDGAGCFIPYNLITQHSIPDKSIADCVEALIGAYLLECGPRGALLFMSWLGIRVLPRHECPLPAHHPYVSAYRHPTHSDQKPQTPPTPKPKTHDATDSDTDSSSDDEEPWQQQQEFFPETDWSWPGRPVGSLRPYKAENGQWIQPIFGELKAPPSPLLRYIGDPDGELEQMLSGYDALERTLQYRFKDRSLLLQALTHASHQQNRLTDCYQRLEFLGDAILDYLITRHLYEDPRRHSPGALTDLRSALVNNTIFATLAARHGFHKYFRHMSPGLNEVLTKYVKIQEENGHSISEEHYLIQEDEMEQAEDVEVPKALGDLFESVAGAIFLDSGMSLGAVWKSYVNLMGAELEAFSAAAPKSPVRELLEAEPDTAKFGKPERLADGRRVRVCVEVFGRGAFKGVGRNYRIAKGTAARCALRHLRVHRAR